jgi:hypothetical protein
MTSHISKPNDRESRARLMRSHCVAIVAASIAIATAATIAAAQALPTPDEQADEAGPKVAAPASAEFDLDLGLGMQGTLQDYADTWMAKRASEGLRYNVAVGMADILGEPGQSNYIESYDLALQKAILKAHSQFISEIVANDVNQEIRNFSDEKRGFDEAKAEKACLDRPAARLSAKLAEAANAVANRMISELGGEVDSSTDLDRSVKCVANSLVETMSRSTEVARQRAIRGARVLKVKIENKRVGVAVAYGSAGIDLANALKNPKPTATALPTARAEIGAWVDKNMLSDPEILNLVGIRSFKLSNGEWAVVSLAIAGVPGEAGMSETELRIRATNAFPRSDVNAMGQLRSFAGASVKSFESVDDNADYVKSFDTEIRDGVVTASVDTTVIEGAMTREVASIAQGKLASGVVTVKSGARASAVGGRKVVYTVRAWSPTLYADARATDSELSDRRAAAAPGSASGGTGTGTVTQSESREMKEDW